jgi:hypothetical protein
MNSRYCIGGRGESLYMAVKRAILISAVSECLFRVSKGWDFTASYEVDGADQKDAFDMALAFEIKNITKPV